jgi:hypothetical protein
MRYLSAISVPLMPRGSRRDDGTLMKALDFQDESAPTPPRRVRPRPGIVADFFGAR